MIDTAQDLRPDEATPYKDDPAAIVKEAFAVLMSENERPKSAADGKRRGAPTRRQDGVRRPLS